MNGSAREWWAEHLPWIVIALLGLWLPPAAYAVAVPRSWNDPVTVATVAELTCMSVALPGLPFVADCGKSGDSLRRCRDARELWSIGR